MTTQENKTTPAEIAESNFFAAVDQVLNYETPRASFEAYSENVYDCCVENDDTEFVAVELYDHLVRKHSEAIFQSMWTS
jgi:hypothetical protein